MAKTINRDINARIQAICDNIFNGNLSQMAKSTYISRTTLISIVGEQQSSPGYDVLRKIVEMPTANINESWLLTGEGEMIIKDKPTPEIPIFLSGCQDMKRRRYGVMLLAIQWNRRLTTAIL